MADDSAFEDPGGGSVGSTAARKRSSRSARRAEVSGLGLANDGRGAGEIWPSGSVAGETVGEAAGEEGVGEEAGGT
jgi:hypothetical protein